MILWHIALLAIIQGISEPLPISSSGHLALLHHVLDPNLMGEAALARQIDIAVHIGTLGALLLFFWRDLVQLIQGGFAMLRGDIKGEQSRTVQYLLVASIPAVIAGYFMSKVDPAFFYNVERIAWMLIIFGIVLGIADRFSPKEKTLESMTFKRAFVFGLAQILSFLPGTSRSGITMTAGRFMGFDRVSAAKFSFMMAMIATAGAGLIGTIDVIQTGDFSAGLNFIVAIVLSFATTYVALMFLMKWLVTHDFMPFVVYRILLGGLVLTLFYSGFFE